MRVGRASGTHESPAPEARGIDVLGAFVNEDGYTSISVALALLVSLALLFSAASVSWVMSRAASTQEVADACALAGENSVAGFTTIAQVLDACVLSMGLAGVIGLGGGLVLSAVPGAGPIGAEMVASSRSLLSSRREFAQSAARGLERLEASLPLIIAANAARCVQANATDETHYTGLALPFPAESHSVYDTADDVSVEAFDGIGERMQEVAAREEEAAKRADEAKRRAWEADCGSSSYCMRERASALAQLAGTRNPFYTLERWNFGAALSRARAYYRARLASEHPLASSVEAAVDSACRKRFYTYAVREVEAGHYAEYADGTVEIDLPELPHNTSEMRQTTLYTEAVWPCTAEQEGRTLHAYAGCPGARGAHSGVASLAQLETHQVRTCRICDMDAVDMGKVAAASTSTTNGFEHWWREVVEASKVYEQARRECADAERELREIGKEGASAFDEALEALSAPRPKLCPPGAWGCVGVCMRDAEEVPSELTQAFLRAEELPAGAAISGAVLAPDEATAENNVLARFCDGLGLGGGSGIVGSICSLWGQLLVSYGSNYQTAGDAADSFFSGLEGVGAKTAAGWLRDTLSSLVRDAGFAPVDMRLKKPVLTNTANILAKSGYDKDATVRTLIEKLPDSDDPVVMAAALGRYLVNEYGGSSTTLAELPLPGTGRSMPLTIDLESLAGAL